MTNINELNSNNSKKGAGLSYDRRPQKSTSLNYSRTREKKQFADFVKHTKKSQK